MWIELPAKLQKTHRDPNGLVQTPIITDLGVHPVMINVAAVHTICPDPEDRTQTKLFIGGASYDILEPYEKVRRIIRGTSMRSTVE